MAGTTGTTDPRGEVGQAGALPRVEVLHLDGMVVVVFRRPGRVTRFRYRVMAGKVGGWVVIGSVIETLEDGEHQVMVVAAGFLSEDAAVAAMMRYARLKAEALRRLPL